jgi:surface polysaccharide O-acyltransferase-like enzyme
VLAANDGLGARWLLWPNLAIAAYFVLVALFITLLVTGAKQQPVPGLETATLIAFAISCTTSSVAFLSLFLRFAQKRSPIFNSLSRNAYGIYIVHYAFVSWLQFALLGAAWPGFAKGCTVFVGALALSWASVAALRRIPGVGKVI